jgi:hypothetical protein
MHQYTLSEDDITVYMLYYISSNKKVKNKGKIFLYLVSVYFVLLAGISYATDNISTAITMLCLALLWAVYTRFIRHYLMTKNIGKTVRRDFSQIIGLQMQFEVESSYIHMKDLAGDYKYFFSGIVSISELKAHFFFKLNNAHCFVIPKTNDELEQSIRGMIVSHSIPYQLNLDWKY